MSFIFSLIWINKSTENRNLEALRKITVEPLSCWWKFMAPSKRKACKERKLKIGGSEPSPRPLFQGVFKEQEQKGSYCCIWHVICYSSFSFIKLDFHSLRKVSDSQLFPYVSFYCYENFLLLTMQWSYCSVTGREKDNYAEKEKGRWKNLFWVWISLVVVWSQWELLQGKRQKYLLGVSGLG